MSYKKENKELHKKKMLEALTITNGIVTTAAKMCTIASDYHYDWMKEDPAYKLAVEAIDNIMLDVAEGQLMKKIKEGNLTALIFYLKCKGKQRGYIDRVVLDGNIQHDVHQLNIQVNDTATKKLMMDAVKMIGKEHAKVIDVKQIQGHKEETPDDDLDNFDDETK
jgi:hypothetical protein